MTKQSPWPADNVERWPIEKLTPYANNARTHSDEQVAQVAASIEEWGWTTPVLVDETGELIAGHCRVLAARKLGIETVPVMVATGWTEAQKRAYTLADNQLALGSGWDEAILRSELDALAALDFDMPLLGFDEGELAAIFNPPQDGLTDPDNVPETPADPVSVLGDVWVLGKHRIMCGSSTSLDDVTKAIGGASIDIVCSDPPYGISVVKGSSVGGAGIIAPGTYAPIIGDDTTETAVAHYNLIVAMGVPVIALWGGNYFANALPPSRCWLVWDKENTGTFADAELAWTNQDKVVKLIRHQWSGLIKASERGQKRVHPTQKPVALAEWVIETLAPEAKVLFDGFLGSGWTLIAAEQRGIACVGMELSPSYVDVAVLRWEQFTGEEATHAETGQTFAQVALERGVDLAAPHVAEAAE